MEKDPMHTVTTYELATLASRINPARCISDARAAIAEAAALLKEARRASWRLNGLLQVDPEEVEADEKFMTETRQNWVGGIKSITHERRRDRATKRFREFMHHELPTKAKEQLKIYELNGFTLKEMFSLELGFELRKKAGRKKGKQGRRKSKHDGRLRNNLVGLVAAKPPKPI